MKLGCVLKEEDTFARQSKQEKNISDQGTIVYAKAKW